MTPEQAVAWLILEGWRVVVDPNDGGPTIRWFPADNGYYRVPRTKPHLTEVTQGTYWQRSEFKRCPDISPAEYPQYAAQVVDMILRGEVIGKTS